MRLTDPVGWAAAVAANPVPGGWAPDPAEWPPHGEMREEDRADACAAIVIVVAERWADAMEYAVDQGVSIAECAADALATVDREVGTWHLSGFHYGLCVGLLAKVWEYGEDLRRWHNLDVQLAAEGVRANESGGVLNPGLVSLRGPSYAAHQLDSGDAVRRDGPTACRGAQG